MRFAEAEAQVQEALRLDPALAGAQATLDQIRRLRSAASRPASTTFSSPPPPL
jgi:hypothetical protein